MATSVSEWLAGSSGGGTLLRVKELEEQQQALLKSVICAFNQLLDLRDLGTGIHSTRLAEGAVPGCQKTGTCRIVAVIDAYDAMVSNRCYRQGLSHEEAVGRLTAGGGTQFDPIVVQAFVEIAGQEVAEVFAATGSSPSAVI